MIRSMEEMISFIIVNWNTIDLTIKAIQSIGTHIRQEHEIIVIDNHSSDGSVEILQQRFPELRLIANDDNRGYARANNQGMEIARGDVFILLNSDAELLSFDIVPRIRKHFVDHKRTGIIGATLLLPNGRVQSVGRSFLTLKKLIKNQLLFASVSKQVIPERPFSTDYVDGAFLAIRRETVRDIGMLDHHYFMYGEDMEWCMRAWEKGWRVDVLPDVRILHHHAASTKQDLGHVLVENAISSSRFIARREGLNAGKNAFLVYTVGAFLRIFMSMLRRNGLAQHYQHAFRQLLKRRTQLKHILAK